jgi:DNA-binding winged helix-turn-helix (wHTH) protein
MAIEFGPFTFDADRRQLLRAGAEVHLSNKAFELLGLMLAHRSRVLAKTEIHERLWGGTFVSDATLASVVSEIRTALGESARKPSFIKTVHGYGYGFTAEATDPAAAAGASEGDRQRPQRRPCWLKCGEREFDLDEGENILGRDANLAVCLDSLSVSRRHARIVIAPGRATLEDLGSRNGTYVDDVRVSTPMPLRDGVAIRLGGVTLVFRSLAMPASTRVEP